MIYDINNIEVQLEFDFDMRYLKISAYSLKTVFSFVFDEQQFLNFLNDNGILEVEEDVILWDTYIEDEDGITYMETHGINFVDYVKNYISKDVLEDIIRISLDEFITNFKNQ